MNVVSHELKRTVRGIPVCDECGAECFVHLAEIRTELPDYPHYEYLQAWVSDCHDAPFHFPTTERPSA